MAEGQTGDCRFEVVRYMRLKPQPAFSVGALLVSVISILPTFCNWSKSAVLFSSIFAQDTRENVKVDKLATTELWRSLVVPTAWFNYSAYYLAKHSAAI